LEPTSLEALRRFVQEVICERGELLPGAFLFDEQVLRRHGHPNARPKPSLVTPQAKAFSLLCEIGICRKQVLEETTRLFQGTSKTTSW
jgi:hypothetical protein